ncbi:HlyD family efflux transporter periplasmic adaptor subunit [Streptococcus ratti]|uniref:ComB, accessory factor for ComA n=1 Tax=Streptococcus ratti FA-1 = DSM 20564 TaxID=699248 RepID=A0ABP2QZS0_STRRT|nr:HlyD family efflux transporter periplasmic adaptor subunit [Streptococcus ratti]EJN94568.1 putative ComB, accessory factor for ComA [Streptococcus ratti FA-1 = DSM 20564]EMP71312.1 putative ComB [Streptococcus ratti FA-1 = DSM 20564]QEY06498.1 HlyD family efflux transporter periplasmic adaptor subunit [Streptococcus ratti]VEI60841.1 putative ComB [Streptococcus mutans]
MDPKFLQSAEFYRRRYHNFATLLIIPLVCLIIFIAVFLCFAKKEITVTSTGEVAPTRVVSVIQSYSDTSIIKNNLDNNASVKKGDLLIQYSETADSKRRAEQKKIVEERQKRAKEAKKQEQKTDKKASKKKSEKKSESKDSKKDTDNKDSKKKKTEKKNSGDGDEIKKVSIFASDDGIIHTNPKYEGMNLMPKGAEIGQLYPDIRKTKKVLITYYVSSDDVVSMKKGQKTRLSMERKGNDRITLEGKISTVALSATKTKNGNLFKVTAKVTVSKKDSKLVKYGMTGKTVTVTDKKTYFNYFKDKLLNKLDN